MHVALVDSGLGVLPAAAELCRRGIGGRLVLSIDPDGMPWGGRSPDEIARRALACARAALLYEPDAVVFACNTASVQALSALRAELEPAVAVVGTVPAIKPAAAPGEPVAIWATPATTTSAYQQDLIARFAGAVPVTQVACPGLAEAVEAGDEGVLSAAVARAAGRTPGDTRAVVLGCTQYELAAEAISSHVPGVRLYGSAAAVAAQTVRRASARGAIPDPGRPELHVLLSGEAGALPDAALRYHAGRAVQAAVTAPAGYETAR